MHFCDDCGNMYYIHISDTDGDQLVHFCRKCGKKSNIITEDNICVSSITLKRGIQKTNIMVNEYTKLDPTLPRVNNIPCPNSACESNTEPDTKPEILYMRYDDINMKYIYTCILCNKVWKLDEN